MLAVSGVCHFLKRMSFGASGLLTVGPPLQKTQQILSPHLNAPSAAWMKGQEPEPVELQAVSQQ